MTSYDEDLMANRFFISMLEICPELYATATANRWTICVPKTGTFSDTVLTEMDFQNHVLLPVEGGEHDYQTVHGKQVFVRGGTIVTGTGFEEVRSVPILFEETFFNEAQQSYRIICLATLLEGGALPDDDTARGPHAPPSSLNECKQLLWGHDDSKKLQRRIDEQIDILNRSCDRLQGESLDLYIEAASIMFHNATQVVLKDRMLKTIVDNDEPFAEKLKVAVETYTMHGAYHKLFRGIAAAHAVQDAEVNKIIRNLSHIQIQDLKISSEFVHNIPRARKALSDLVTFSTPMGKLLCIRRVVFALMHASTYTQDDQASPENGKRPMTTDDLLPMLIFMMIKSQIGNWSAHLCYMRKFRFSKSKNDDELGYFLVSFDAALEHLISRQLNPSQLHYFNYPVPSWALQTLSPYNRSENKEGLTRLKEFFTAINAGDVVLVCAMMDASPPNKVENSPQLCHPLCSCEKCERIVSLSKDPNHGLTMLSTDERGFTALHVAAWYGRLDILEILLKTGGLLHAASCSGSTPLHMACQRGHQNIILLLLHYGADPSAVDGNGNTPLHLSATNGHEDCVKALIYYDRIRTKVDVNAINDVGDTPLHNAARWGYGHIIRVLLENGASITVRNRKKQTPGNCAHTIKTFRLILAIAEKESESLRFPQVPTPQQATDAARITREKVQPINALSTSPEKPILTPTKSYLDRLLRSIADGDLPLVRYLMGWSSDSESEEDDETLSKRELCHPLCQCRRCVPLQRTRSFSSRSLITGINSSTTDGITCLHMAVLHGQAKIADLLLRKGADANLGNTKANVSPLHLACQYNKSDMVRLLLLHGAQMDRVDSKGNSPLHFCAMNGCINAASILLENQVNIDAVNARGDTPLHESVRWNMKSMVELLLQHGASTDIRNGLRLTAFQLAKANESIADLFRKYVKDQASLEKADRRLSLPANVDQTDGGIPLFATKRFESLDESAERVSGRFGLPSPTSQTDEQSLASKMFEGLDDLSVNQNVEIDVQEFHSASLRQEKTYDCSASRHEQPLHYNNKINSGDFEQSLETETENETEPK